MSVMATACRCATLLQQTRHADRPSSALRFASALDPWKSHRGGVMRRSRRSGGAWRLCVASVLLGSCRAIEFASPGPELPRRNTSVADPLYVGIQRVADQCPGVGELLQNMYANGQISYGPMVNPTHTAETTWNYNPTTGAVQPGSERITLSPPLNSGNFEEAADRAHCWLAHEAGHLFGEDHPAIPGANTQTGLACY